MRTTGKRSALTGIAVVGVLLSNTSGQVVTPPTATPAPPARPPIELALTSLKQDATIEIGGDRQMALAGSAIWVSDRRTGSLHRIDPKTNTAGKPVPLNPAGAKSCQPVLAAFKSLWVALCGSPGLFRFDEMAEKPPVAVSVEVRTAGPIATGAGSIWMITDTAGALARIDPDTNAAVAEIAVPSGANAMTFGLGALWVTSSTGGTVTRVNGDTNVVVEIIKVGRGPVSVAIGEGSAWTMNGGDGTVSRIDPKTNKVIETIKTGVTGAEGTIALGEGSVWLSAAGTPLTRIDPAINRMVQQFTGPGGGSLAIGLKSLWLAATPTAVWRVDPKRVEATVK